MDDDDKQLPPHRTVRLSYNADITVTDKMMDEMYKKLSPEMRTKYDSYAAELEADKRESMEDIEEERKALYNETLREKERKIMSQNWMVVTPVGMKQILPSEIHKRAAKETDTEVNPQFKHEQEVVEAYTFERKYEFLRAETERAEQLNNFESAKKEKSEKQDDGKGAEGNLKSDFNKNAPDKGDHGRE